MSFFPPALERIRYQPVSLNPKAYQSSFYLPANHPAIPGNRAFSIAKTRIRGARPYLAVRRPMFTRRRYRRRVRPRRRSRRRYKRSSRTRRYRKTRRVRAMGMTGRVRRYPVTNPPSGHGTFRVNGIIYDGSDAGTVNSLGTQMSVYGTLAGGPSVTNVEEWFAIGVPLLPFRLDSATASTNKCIIVSNGVAPTTSVNAGGVISCSRLAWNYDELNAYRELRCEWATYTITIVENFHVELTALGAGNSQMPTLEIRRVNWDSNPWLLPSGGVNCGTTDRITMDHTFTGQTNYNKLIKKIKIPIEVPVDLDGTNYSALEKCRTHVFKITVKNPGRKLKTLFHHPSNDLDPEGISEDGFFAHNNWTSVHDAMGSPYVKYAPEPGIMFKLSHGHESATNINTVKGNMYVKRVSISSQWTGRGSVIGDRGY